MNSSDNLIGLIKDVIPIIERIFMMLLPSILPNAKSVLFDSAAINEVISSGRLVPIAMIVTPIILSDIPNSFEIITANEDFYILDNLK